MKGVHRKYKMHVASLLLVIFGGIICSCSTQKAETNFLNEVPLTKEWMEAYLKQPIPEGARKSRYFDIIKKNKGDYCNLDVDFFTNC